MGFRFHNLNSLYRASIHTHKNKNFHLNPIIQTLNSHIQDPSVTLSDNPIYKIPRRWHLGHSHHHDRDQDQRDRMSGKEGENIFRLGLAADIGLATGKALTGYLTGSTAIIADAAHSVSDVVNFILISFLLFYFVLIAHVVCCGELLLCLKIGGAMELCMFTMLCKSWVAYIA